MPVTQSIPPSVGLAPQNASLGIAPLLTELSLGVIPDRNYVFPLAAPLVPVARRDAKIMRFGPERFSYVNSQRAARTDSKRVNWGYGMDTIHIPNFSLEHAADRMLEVMPKEDLLGVGYHAENLQILMDLHYQAIEVETAAMVTDAGIYDDNHKTTLVGGAKLSDPTASLIGASREWSEAIRTSTARRPNLAIIPSRVMDAIDVLEEVRARLQPTSSASATPDMLANWLKVERVVVAESLVLSEESDELVDIWGNSIVMAFVNPNAIRGDLAFVPGSDVFKRSPSAFYNYVLDGHPFAEPMYEERSTKSVVYTVNYDRAPVVTWQGAAFLVQDVL